MMMKTHRQGKQCRRIETSYPRRRRLGQASRPRSFDVAHSGGTNPQFTNRHSLSNFCEKNNKLRYSWMVLNFVISWTNINVSKKGLCSMESKAQTNSVLSRKEESNINLISVSMYKPRASMSVCFKLLLSDHTRGCPLIAGGRDPDKQCFKFRGHRVPAVTNCRSRWPLTVQVIIASPGRKV
jgi:hypothetical protein